MIQKLTSAVLVGTLIVLSGCQSTFTPLSVRFTMSDQPVQSAEATSDSQPVVFMQASGERFNTSLSESAFSDPADTIRVSMWGGKFAGKEVSMGATPLQPGEYTFVSTNQNEKVPVRGWIQVNGTGNSLVDMLHVWKNDIPTEKERLAFGFELQGGPESNDKTVFRQLAKQLEAFDRLERRINDTIIRESMSQSQAAVRASAIVQNAEILLFPFGSGTFQPTTQPAFAPPEISRIRSGDAITKMLVLADFPEAQRKLRVINELRRELAACKSVLNEEIDRLEQRQRFYRITEHIYGFDEEFVEIEARLQQAVVAVESINDRLADLRQRRIGIAFISALAAADRSFDAIDQEQRDLEDERQFLQVKQQSLEQIADQVDERSSKLASLNRQKQRNVRAIESVNRQIARLAEGRVTLRALKTKSHSIHRLGDVQLFAVVVGDEVPVGVRQAISNEALMAVRLEPDNTLFVPADIEETQTRTAADFSTTVEQ